MNAVAYERVLHPTDFSESDAAAFAHALRIALAGKDQLALLHVCKWGEDVSQEDFPHVRATLLRWLHLLPPERQKGLELGDMNVCKFTKTGNDPVAGVLAHLQEYPPDLMVLATHQYEGIDRLLHKPTAQPIARYSRLKTLFVPRIGEGFVAVEDGALRLRHVLVPVDHEPEPQLALDAAACLLRLLQIRDAEISILHVSDEPEGPTLVLPADAGWQVNRYVTKGNVVDTILQVAAEKRPELIVMATEGRNGFLDALRGSMTERVVREARCPVLAVPVR
ncbi:MAG: putative Universal stress protein [Verrucomicrobia bacterium]|jgi:nucleotide-binding universal stress UspA family protein|nr:putative Universal stress protein [Verrucomicrobiota bacterium]